MQRALTGLAVLALLAACRSTSDLAAELDAYGRGLLAGAEAPGAADAIARAELARLDPGKRTSEGRDIALRYHEQALAASDPGAALARAEVANALLAETCAGCVRDRIPVLLTLARIYGERGDARALARCAERTRRLDSHGLDARNLSDWAMLRRLAELHERLGDFAGAARIERSILDAKLQILDDGHPQVAASRERVAALERRAAQGGVGELQPAPPDPHR